MKSPPLSLVLLALVLSVAPAADSPSPPLPSVEEAKVRSQLLHASIDGSLRVMHRDFFQKGDSRAIPSKSLTDVFKTIAEDWGVTLRWFASEDTLMSRDNKAMDVFQTTALEKFTSGGNHHAVVEDGRLRFAGVIVLQNQCLKCHVSERMSLEERFAGLEISMPVKTSEAGAKP